MKLFQVAKIMLVVSVVLLVQLQTAKARDTDRDGVLDAQDKCPSRKEVYNKKLDDDGCPDTLHIEIKGSLNTAESNKPLRGRVTIVGDGGSIVLQVNGAFEWQVNKGGFYTILAEAQGFASQVQTILVTPGQSVKLTLHFSP